MRSRRDIRFLAVLFLGALGACAATPEFTPPPLGDDIQYARGDSVGQLCFSRQIRSFTPHASNQLIVSLRNGREYLLSTSLCRELDDAHHLAVRSFGPCLSRGDAIQIERHFGGPSRGGHSAQCRILAIHEWLPGASKQVDG